MTAFFDRLRFGKKAPAEKAGAPVGGAKKADSTKKKATKKVSKAEDKKVAELPTEIRDTGIAHRILEAPVISEKTARIGEQNQYAFIVPITATKLQVKEAVHRAYGVRPAGVNIVRMQGKRVRFGRQRGKQKDWKKAIVSFAPGQKITFYEGV